MAQQQIEGASQQASQLRQTEPLIPRSMQWFFLILVTLWVFAAMAFPVIAFCITKNPSCFWLIGNLAPPFYILYRITRYLFPKSEKDYELDKMRIEHGRGKQQ